MKIEKLKPEQVVYSVERRKMGNTTMSTVCVYHVKIIEVNLLNGYVIASWNGNRAQKFYGRDFKKWREKKPMTVTSPMGRCRLMTREEKVAAKAASLKDVKEHRAEILAMADSPNDNHQA
jgi:hypothetical protein